jgi:protein-tyrosine-phosphatase
MDSYQARQLARTFPINRARIVIAGDLDPRFDASRAITDPWNRSSDVFASSFDRLDRCAATLVSILQRPK